MAHFLLMITKKLIVGYLTIQMLLDSDRNCNDMSWEFSFEKYSIIYCETFQFVGKNFLKLWGFFAYLWGCNFVDRCGGF